MQMSIKSASLGYKHKHRLPDSKY